MYMYIFLNYILSVIQIVAFVFEFYIVLNSVVVFKFRELKQKKYYDGVFFFILCKLN